MSSNYYDSQLNFDLENLLNKFTLICVVFACMNFAMYFFDNTPKYKIELSTNNKIIETYRVEAENDSLLIQQVNHKINYHRNKGEKIDDYNVYKITKSKIFDF